MSRQGLLPWWGQWPKTLYEYLVYYGGLLLFAVMCLGWSLVALPLVIILPKRYARYLGRLMIMGGFRAYLRFIELSGIVRYDLQQIDLLRKEKSLILAPNHPSLIDVVLIISRLPNVVCIIKSSLWQQLIFSGSVRMAGYIRNISQARLINEAKRDIESGGQLLVFPEGTRTLGNQLAPFKGGFALIAKRAQAPVQTLFIEINHPFLSKGRSLLRKPEFPLRFHVRLGERFMPPSDVRPFIASLQQYCHHEVMGREVQSHAATDLTNQP